MLTSSSNIRRNFGSDMPANSSEPDSSELVPLSPDDGEPGAEPSSALS